MYIFFGHTYPLNFLHAQDDQIRAYFMPWKMMTMGYDDDYFETIFLLNMSFFKKNFKKLNSSYKCLEFQLQGLLHLVRPFLGCEMSGNVIVV